MFGLINGKHKESLTFSCFLVFHWAVSRWFVNIDFSYHLSSSLWLTFSLSKSAQISWPVFSIARKVLKFVKYNIHCFIYDMVIHDDSHKPGVSEGKSWRSVHVINLLEDYQHLESLHRATKDNHHMCIKYEYYTNDAVPLKLKKQNQAPNQVKSIQMGWRVMIKIYQTKDQYLCIVESGGW